MENTNKKIVRFVMMDLNLMNIWILK